MRPFRHRHDGARDRLAKERFGVTRDFLHEKRGQLLPREFAVAQPDGLAPPHPTLERGRRAFRIEHGLPTLAQLRRFFLRKPEAEHGPASVRVILRP